MDIQSTNKTIKSLLQEDSIHEGLSRKDFVKLADLLREFPLPQEFVKGLMEVLKGINPAFDPEKFMAHINK